MSRIDELIQQLCPDGVETTKLSSICEIYDGTHQTPKYTEHGVRFVSVENIGDLYRSQKFISIEDFDKNYKVKPRKNDVFMTRIGTIGSCAVINSDEPLAYYVTLTLIRPNLNKILSKFLKYSLEGVNGQRELWKHTLINATPIKINLGDIGKVSLHLPPLPVQEEIVRILDKFTALEAELEAELEARRKQYEYYCRKIIDTSKNAVLTRIQDLGKWRGGCTPSMFQKKYWEGGVIPWISSKDMKNPILTDTQNHITQSALEETSIQLLPPGTVAIVARSGILKHTLPIAYVPFAATVNQDIKALIAKSTIVSRYAMMTLLAYRTEILNKTKKAGGTVDSLDISKFMRFQVPVPPQPEQERIVAILDKFDALVNDISSGLPAELEMRRKQYEYYRDRLLTFPKKKA